jgi:secondary thiamine-phosphate synthase enzyme
MPAHLKASIIGQTVTVPITNKKLNLGTWQGIYFCEFRNNGGKRKLLLSVYS